MLNLSNIWEKLKTNHSFQCYPFLEGVILEETGKHTVFLYL